MTADEFFTGKKALSGKHTDNVPEGGNDSYRLKSYSDKTESVSSWEKQGPESSRELRQTALPDVQMPKTRGRKKKMTDVSDKAEARKDENVESNNSSTRITTRSMRSQSVEPHLPTKQPSPPKSSLDKKVHQVTSC